MASPFDFSSFLMTPPIPGDPYGNTDDGTNNPPPYYPRQHLSPNDSFSQLNPQSQHFRRQQGQQQKQDARQQQSQQYGSSLLSQTRTEGEGASNRGDGSEADPSHGGGEDNTSSSILPSFDERDYGLDPSAFSNVTFQMPSFLAASTPGQLGDGAPNMVDPSAINPPAPAQAFQPPNFANSQQETRTASDASSKREQQMRRPGGPNYSAPKNVYVPDVRNPVYGIYGSSVISVNPDPTPFKTRPEASSRPPARQGEEPKSRGSTPDFDPSKLGLPVGSSLFPQSLPGLYSSSGFDMLGVLARVVARPNPQINIGPVDTSCSFVVVDAKRYDMPIVFASSTFTALTGYTNAEIIGKNCRFLQAPDGKVEAGARRKYTDGNAVYHLRTHIHSGKETQASVINYRKDGSPFINLVTVIPITWDTEDIAYFVGFQVDLVEQPNAILEKMRDGTYVVNYSLLPMTSNPAVLAVASDVSQKDDEAIVLDDHRDPPAPTGAGGAGGFGKLDTSSAAVAAAQSSMSIAPQLLELLGLVDNSQEVDDEAVKKKWNKMLLDHTGDFVHVLSLKGSFLYVSPSVKAMLEYDAPDLVGKTLQSFCHPSDIVPVMRELKDSGSNTQPIINLLYRMKKKRSGYVWIEAQGKLYLEQSKSRKCVILVGRERPVYQLAWNDLNSVGGLGEKEFWSKLSPGGMILYNTPSVEGVLGHDADTLRGTSLFEISDENEKVPLAQALIDAENGKSTRLRHKLRNRKGQYVDVVTNFFPTSTASLPKTVTPGVVHPSIVAQTNEYASEVRRRATKAKPERVTPSIEGLSPIPATRPLLHRTSSSVRDMIVTTPRGSGDSGSDSDKSGSPKDTSGPENSRAGSASGSGSDSSAPSTFSVIPSTFKALVQHPNSVSDNVFDELDTTRTTSWQYELHQLKLTNKKLKEELRMLQAAKRKRKKKEGKELREGLSPASASPAPPANPAIKACANCGRTDSPEWRVGPTGTRNLCNACGLRWAKATRGTGAKNSTPSFSTPSSGGSDVDAAGSYLQPAAGPFAPVPSRPQLQHAESSRFQNTNH